VLPVKLFIHSTSYYNDHEVSRIEYVDDRRSESTAQVASSCRPSWRLK
jgi:hypothetical protein